MATEGSRAQEDPEVPPAGYRRPGRAWLRGGAARARGPRRGARRGRLRASKDRRVRALQAGADGRGI